MAKIEPFISPGRESHNHPLAERFSEPALHAKDATPLEEMRHKPNTAEGGFSMRSASARVEPFF
jgi:hypothetical protein